MKWLVRAILITVAIMAVCTGEDAPAQGHHGDGHGHGQSHGAAIELGEVLVTAVRIKEYIDNHPQQVVVMTREQMDQGSFTDLNQVLDAMPGVEVKKSGSGMGSRISIRGSGDGGKILVLINGRPANNTQYGSVDLDSIPLTMVKRVEVFKPPIPVWLGPGGTAGAVNITLADMAGNGKKAQKTTRIGMQAGSFGKIGGNAAHQMLLKSHQIRITAAANHRDGRRPNNDHDNGSLGFQWNLPGTENTEYDLNARYYQSEHGSPGRTGNPTPHARQTYKKGALDFRAKGVWMEACAFELKTYLDVKSLKDDSESGGESTLDTMTYGIKNEMSWQDNDGKRAVRLSGNLAQDFIDHETQDILDGNTSDDHHREHGFLGIQGDQSWNNITASLGGRCDYTSDFGFQPAVTGGVTIPIGARSQAKVNGGYTVNIPTFGQLYQPSHGSIDQVRGNPDLKEEGVWSFSAGVSHAFTKDRTVEVTAFREDRDDAIVYYEGEDDLFRPVNIDGSYRQGIEAVVSWTFSPRVNLDMSYVWQKGRNRENDEDLTYTPERKFKTTLNWAFATKTRTVTTLSHVSNQYSDLENTREKKVDGYTTVDFKFIQPIQLKKYQWEFFIYFENLLDESYEVHHGYPDDGFRFTTGMNLDF